jgi:hypothetical protein
VRLNSHNFEIGLDYGKTRDPKNQKLGSIVATILQPQSSSNSYNFAATDFDYTTGSKHQMPAKSLNYYPAVTATKKSRLSCFSAHRDSLTQTPDKPLRSHHT